MYKFLEETAATYMTGTVKAVTGDITMRTLQKKFEDDDFNAYPVLDGRRMIGLVTKFDFLKCFAFSPMSMVPRYDDLMERTVAEIMKPEFIYVDSSTKLPRVLQLMVTQRIRSIPVMDGHKLSGMISREDIMRALASGACENL
ncbi:MAG: CBS domain-containing protein [Xanthobacteraceae bacterium]|nr:CBS domain-containing protein [Xanthobacteraceae bacterium]